MASLGELELCSGETRRRADEWALVLSSQGIAFRVVRTEEGHSIRVAWEDGPRAEAALGAYVEENAGDDALPPPEEAEAGSWGVALTVAFALAVFHAVTGPAGSESVWFEAGSADAARIQAGEAWRVVTALGLHSDLIHVAGNAVLGGILLVALSRMLGGGLACALVLAAGAGGNLLNAMLRSAAHVSVGASTAVFGSVGLLAGTGATRRRLRGQRWGRALAPLAAGLGVLAMLGSGGGRVDVFAHLFGLVVGTFLGAGAGWLVPRPPRAAAQWLFGLGALGLVLASWLRALAG